MTDHHHPKERVMPPEIRALQEELWENLKKVNQEVGWIVTVEYGTSFPLRVWAPMTPGLPLGHGKLRQILEVREGDDLAYAAKAAEEFRYRT